MPEEICTVGLSHRQIACMSTRSWADPTTRVLGFVGIDDVSFYNCGLV
jgi:hypothetical protein